MLIRFVVKNFLSFREETEFNMLTGNFPDKNSHIYKDDSGIDVLKSAAIYGANGSGKSNLIKAIYFLKKLVVDGTNKVNQIISIPKFKLDKTCNSLPTQFEIEFKRNEKSYSYGIAIKDNKIIDEWLYIITSSNEELIFTRAVNENKNKIELHSKYLKDEKSTLLRELYEDDILRLNQPFITEVFGKNFDEINEAYKWFDENLEIIFPASKYFPLIEHLSTVDDFKDFTAKTLDAVNTGVHQIDTETVQFHELFKDENSQLKEEILETVNERQGVTIEIRGELYSVFQPDELNVSAKKLVLKHKGVEDNLFDFKLKEESDGTQRLLDLIPAIYGAFNNKDVILVDEIDRSMHPSISRGLIETFLNNVRTKGQLIFTTHESNLLDLKLFRRDEIWFVEKSKIGASQVYSLSEFKPLPDVDIQKGYLKGRFGAIPFVGNLKDLSWEENAEAK